MSHKRSCLQKILNIHRKTPVLESLFNNLHAYTSVTLLQRDLCVFRCFPVNIVKFLKTSILKDICKRLLLNFIDSKWK